MNAVELEAWRTVEALNRAWTEGRIEDLGDYFHDDMVAVTPTNRLRLEGRAACLAAWEAFVRSSTVESWHELSPAVRVYGDTAVVTYYYDMTCLVQGERLRLAGRDMMVLVREDGRFRVVADQFSEYPTGTSETTSGPTARPVVAE